MSQNYTSQQIKIKTSVLLFIKGAAAPLVLYVENPEEVYNEFINIINNYHTQSKLIEKTTLGPIKKVCVFSNQISAVALQDEPYLK